MTSVPESVFPWGRCIQVALGQEGKGLFLDPVKEVCNEQE